MTDHKACRQLAVLVLLLLNSLSCNTAAQSFVPGVADEQLSDLNGESSRQGGNTVGSLDVKSKDEDVVLQLLRPSEGHLQFEVNEEALIALDSIEEPVAVVAIVGPYHGGKSFLLNVLLNSTRGFPVGTRPEPETRGLWMRIVPPRLLPPGVPRSPRLVLLDTEGLYGEGATRAYDAKVFAVATLLSSHLVYNTLRTLGDAQSVAALAELARQAQVFNLQNWLHSAAALETEGTEGTEHPPPPASAGARQPVESPPAPGPDPGLLLKTLDFPPLTWVVQGFDLDLDPEDSPLDHLKRYLAAHSRSGDRSIDTLFTRGVACLAVRTPADINGLRERFGAGGLGADVELYPELHPGYRDDVARLRGVVLGKLQAKGGGSFTGRTLAGLLPLLVHYVNADFPLAAERKLREVMVDLLLDSAFAHSVVFFRRHMAARLGTPASPNPSSRTLNPLKTPPKSSPGCSVGSKSGSPLEVPGGGEGKGKGQAGDGKGGGGAGGATVEGVERTGGEVGGQVAALVAAALTPKELDAAMTAAEKEAVAYCERRCVGVPPERTGPACIGQLGAKLAHLKPGYREENEERVQRALVALASGLRQVADHELEAVALPLPEAELSKRCARALQVALSEYDRGVGKHKGGQRYSQSRARLQADVDDKCASVVHANERHITALLAQARERYRASYEELMSPCGLLGERHVGAAAPPPDPTASSAQVSGGKPVAPRQLAQLHAAAVKGGQVAFSQVVTAGGLPWVGTGHEQFDFSQFQNQQWAKQRFSDLQAANEVWIGAICRKEAASQLALYRQKLAGFSPFPDNDEVLAERAKAAEAATVGAYAAALADYTGTAGLEEGRRELLARVQEARAHLLEKNTALMTALCYDPLSDAAKALHMEECHLSYRNVWVARTWWSRKCLWPGPRFLFGFKREAYAVARRHLDAAQLSLRTGANPNPSPNPNPNLKSDAKLHQKPRPAPPSSDAPPMTAGEVMDASEGGGRLGDGARGQQMANLSPATRDKVIDSWIERSLSHHSATVTANFGLLAATLGVLVGTLVWGGWRAARALQWAASLVRLGGGGQQQQQQKEGSERPPAVLGLGTRGSPLKAAVETSGSAYYQRGFSAGQRFGSPQQRPAQAAAAAAAAAAARAPPPAGRSGYGSSYWKVKQESRDLRR
eukprot:jgi/Mesen1/4647/ME000241S03688